MFVALAANAAAFSSRPSAGRPAQSATSTSNGAFWGRLTVGDGDVPGLQG
jgi:hypothetical protein